MGYFEKGRWIEDDVYLGDPISIGSVMYGIKKHIESNYTFDYSRIDFQHVNHSTHQFTSELYIEYVLQLKLCKDIS